MRRAVSAAAGPFQDGLERTGRRRPSDRIASAASEGYGGANRDRRLGQRPGDLHQ